MYSSLPNTRSTAVAIVTLPDGRKVRAEEKGYHEGDTGAWVETSDCVLFWNDGENVGEVLADEEWESPAYPGEEGSMSIFAYVCKFGDWKCE